MANVSSETKLSEWFPRAHYYKMVVRMTTTINLLSFLDKSSHHMAGGLIILVMWSIEIGWYEAPEISLELLIIYP